MRSLQNLLGASWSTTRYHVRNLIRDGEIVSSNDGGHVRLYPLAIAEDQKAVYACIQSETARRILKELMDDPSREVSQTDLSEKIGLPRSTISKWVATLSQVHLVRRTLTPDGHIVFDISDREQVLRLLDSSNDRKNILKDTSDRFIDLWDL